MTVEQERDRHDRTGPGDDPRERRIWMTAATLGTGTFVALVFNLVNGTVLHRGWPFNSFLFIPQDRFADFTNIMAAQAGGRPYDSPLMVYFPFSNVLLRPFEALSDRAGIVVICGFLAAVTVALFVWCTRRIGSVPQQILLVEVIVLSYPVLIAADRANVEIFAYVLLAGFAVSWSQGRHGLATLLLSGAIAAKGTAWIYLALLSRRGHRIHLATCAGLVVLETLAGLVILKSGVIEGAGDFISNLGFYKRTYVIGDAGFLFGHSLFGGAKAVITLVGGGEQRRSFSAGAFGAFAVAGFVSYIVAMVFVVRREWPLWKAMTILTCVSLLFTPTSNDYRLLLLLPPCALFFAHPSRIGSDRLIAFLFGLVMVPKGFHFLLPSESSVLSPTLGVLVSSVVICALLVTVIRSGDISPDVDLETMAQQRAVPVG